ncbi:MAG: M67 family metallopeptidase [Nitrososphaeraceae archaeon]
MKTIMRISQTQLTELVDIATSSLPNESCALLAGEVKDMKIWKDIRVVEIIAARNADQSIVSFSVDEIELIELYERAEARGLQIVGIFHSHPSKPAPSSTDVEFMRINPIVWLIYSSVTHEFRAYILENELQDVEMEST